MPLMVINNVVMVLDFLSSVIFGSVFKKNCVIKGNRAYGLVLVISHCCLFANQSFTESMTPTFFSDISTAE